jgi:hypothetical protein
MLGWFALRPDTGIEDAEWLLARAAGFDAGFALATSLASTAQLEADPASAETARQFGATTAILAAIARWEGARMAGAFPPEVKSWLRDNQREFQLQAAGEGAWELREAFVARFTHEAGQPAPTVFSYPNSPSPQALRWIVRSTGKEPVPGFRLEIGGRRFIDLAGLSLPAGGALRYDGGAEVVVCDGAWREIGRRPVDATLARVGEGPVNVGVSTAPGGGTLRVELRTLGPATRLQKSGP